MTDIQVKNVRPINIHQNVLKYKKYDTQPEEDLYAHATENFIQQFTPINATKQIELIIDTKKEPLTIIKDMLVEALTEDSANTILDERLTMLFQEIAKNKPRQLEYWKYHIAYSYLIENGYPIPDIKNFYTYSVDVQNQAKQFISTLDPNDKKALICGLIGALHQKKNVDGILYILTENSEYQKIKKNIDSIVQTAGSPDVIQQNTGLQQIKLDTDVFTSWTVGSDIEANSINRIILDVLYNLDPNGLSTIIPTSAFNYTIPSIISFINIESLCNANNNQFDDELKTLSFVKNKLTALNIKKLKTIKNAKSVDGNGSSQRFNRKTQNNQDLANRAKLAKFKPKKLSVKFQARRVKQVIDLYMSDVETDNTFKTKKRTFMRPNRRYPDNLNMKGRSVKKSYRPNIHIYLDTSGSVTEEQYKNAIKIIISIVKKVNVDLFFTSFSHTISQPVKLMTKNASTKQIYQQISRVPKVSGGTEFEQVWQMIDSLAAQNDYLEKAKSINFIITDFDYSIRNSYTPNKQKDSTKNTYYLPLAKDQKQYEIVTKYANEFANALIDKNILDIRKKIIL